MATLRMREALRDAMAEEMRRDEGVFVMGEDVGVFQGAFKVTEGLLEEFGFDPRLQADENGHTVLMQHCPFGEVADHYRKIVCSVHLGLMQGALDELGAHVEASELEPFVRPGVCTAHLGARNAGL